MKKLVVILAVLFVSGVVQAQSPRVDSKITHDGLGWTLVPRYALNDSTQKALNAALERAVAKQRLQSGAKIHIPADTTTVKKKPVRSTRAQWLRAIFLGGPFPGESKEAYRQRLQIQSYPASQPFK